MPVAITTSNSGLAGGGPQGRGRKIKCGSSPAPNFLTGHCREVNIKSIHVHRLCTVILREVRHGVLAESRKMDSDVTYFSSDVIPETKTEISNHDRT